MRKKFLLFFPMTILFHLQDALAQNPLVKQWDYRFGGNIMEWNTYCIETSDNGYLIGGSSNSPSGGDKSQFNCDFSLNTFDYWVVKTDSEVNLQWEKRFGGYSEDELSSVIEVSDGYILAGTSQSPTGCDKLSQLKGQDDYWVVKTDFAGDPLRERDYGGTWGNQLSCVLKLANDGILLGGSSSSDSSGDKTQPNWDPSLSTSDYWIVKTDSAGTIIWDKRFGGTEDDRLTSMVKTSDGGFILGGTSFSGADGDKTEPNWNVNLVTSDYWIVKIDSMGNYQWDKRFGGTLSEYIGDVKQTDDGGYILFGSSFSDISGDRTQSNWDPTLATTDYWVVKTDPSGNKLWDRRYGGDNYDGEGRTILLTNDGGYLLTGISYSDSSGDHPERNIFGRQPWIVKIDLNGDIQWTKCIRLNGGGDFCTALQLKDDCFLFPMSTDAGTGGEKTQNNRGDDDYWLIKYCDSNLINSISQAGNEDMMIGIYPNPTTGKFTIQNAQFTIKDKLIYNLLGEKIIIPQIPNSTLPTEADISALPSGIYILQIVAGDKTFHTKIIKE